MRVEEESNEDFIAFIVLLPVVWHGHAWLWMIFGSEITSLSFKQRGQSFEASVLSSPLVSTQQFY
ncbi:hypothetical protein Patl1_17773 [Pistacia atlantica]|uniref:Uncharacterized protein n=1 Tax=Pistacia atlantica TaxID=434234 RepID=A0ACC1C1L5_9ROSI|nr:hypothetical protein Patl1_17773 [Pistacia atlantica]